MGLKHLRSAVLAAAAFSVVAGSFGQAATTGTWTGAGTDANWSTAGNWTGGVPKIAGDTANLNNVNITSDTTITLDTAVVLKSLSIGDKTTASNIYILQLGTNGSLTMDSGATGTNASIQQITTSRGDTLPAMTFNSNVDVTNSAGTSQALTFANAITSNGFDFNFLSNKLLTISGTNTNFAGNWNLSAGTITFASDAAFGSTTGTRMITLDNAILKAGASMTVGSNRVISLGTNGGTIDANAKGINLNSAGQLTGSTSLSLIGTNGGTITLAGANSGLTATTHIGTAGTAVTVNLNAASLNGDIEVASKGALKFGANGVLASGKTITLTGGSLDTTAKTAFAIASNQMIKGVGTWTAGNTTVSGILSIGATHGQSTAASTLAVAESGALTLAGTTQFDLVSASSADQLAMTGAGSLAYGGNLVVSNQTGAALAVGNSWQLFVAPSGGESGLFSNDSVFGTAGDGTTLPTLSDGKWAFDYTTGTLSIQAIPEPASLAMLASGSLLLMRRHRR